MGWYFVEFLICTLRTVLRVFFYCRSLPWERTRALVTGQALNDPYWYSSVQLHYTFDHRGVPMKGCDTHPFMSSASAKDWASTFPHNFPVTIRVNPRDPQKTRFFEVDQKGAVRSFASTFLKAFTAAAIVVAAIVLVVWTSKKFG